MDAMDTKSVLKWAIDAYLNDNLTLAGLEEIFQQAKKECKDEEERDMLDWLFEVIR